MFDKKTVDAYKSIIPSDKMEENILQMYDAYKPPTIYSRLKPISGIAACFVFVLVASVLYFGSNKSLIITNNGEKVSKKSIAVTLEDVPYTSSAQTISLFRSVDYAINCIALDIEIDINQQTKISVSGGMLLLYNDELDNISYAGDSCIIDSSSLIYWSINKFPKTESFTLKLVTKGETTNLSLAFNKDSEKWMLSYSND